MSEKKLQKINWQELVAACSKRGFEVFKLDLNKCLKEQGPFCVLLHKLTDIIALANQGDIRVSKTNQLNSRFNKENIQSSTGIRFVFTPWFP
ncbi:hypothetical protein HUJ04_011693, partial [Dendroctonus ponderosae]